MKETHTRYWLGVVSESHVKRGVAGGFAQLCHGKSNPLKRMATGDWLIYYSPKTEMDGGQPLQKFTAVGQVVGEAAYQVEMTSDFHPYRRDIAYRACQSAAIQPILERLSFITDPKRWGFPFRRGHFEIRLEDFLLITHQMGVNVDEQPKPVCA